MKSRPSSSSSSSDGKKADSSSSSSEDLNSRSTLEEKSEDSEESVYSETEDDLPPLLRHIKYHGGVKGPRDYISFETILEQNEKIALPDACTNALKVSAVAGFFAHWCPFKSFTPGEAAAVLPHAYSTHIFNKDTWEIDEALLKELTDQSVMYHGRPVITETTFRTFLDKCRANEQNPDYIGKTASEGEVEGLFSTFANGKTKAGERYISVNRLKQYYKDSSKVGAKIEEEVRNGTFRVKTK